MTITRLVFVAADDAPWPFLRAAEDGEVLQRGVVPVGSPRPETDDEDRLVTPGADALARWLDLPDRNDKQARSSAAFLLQAEIARDGDDLHVAVGASDVGGQRLAVVTQAESVRRWLELARARGVEPVSMTPDYLMLPEPEGDVVVTAGFGGLTAVRGRNVGFALEPDLADTVIAGRPSRRLSMQDLEPALALRAATPPINLLQGAFGERPAAASPGRRRRMAMLAIALLLSPLVLLLAQTGRDHWATWTAESQIRSRLAAAYPADAKAADPVTALQGRLDLLRRADRFPDLAAGLFSVLEKTPGIQLDTLVYADDGDLRARVSYSNYSDIDQLRAAGRVLGLDIRQNSTVTEGARVTSELVVRRLP